MEETGEKETKISPTQSRSTVTKGEDVSVVDSALPSNINSLDINKEGYVQKVC